MKKRNHVMQAAVASALLVSGGAFAAVNLDTVPVVTAKYASEIVATVAAPVTLANTLSVLDILVKTGYSMNNTEVRYVRMELDNGAKFSTAATVTVTGGTAGQVCTAGAINGLGTGVIYFSLTAGANGCDANSLVLLATGQTITNTNTIQASYSMYDQPSQAQAGGTNGRIVAKAFVPYITFGASYALVGASGTSVTADVAASPSFSKFLLTPSTATTAVLGTLNYSLVTTPGLTAAGATIALTDLMSIGAGGTKLLVSGDFSAAAANTATPPVITPTNIFLSASATCATVGLTATSVTTTTATFNVGATATTANSQLCYTVTGTTAVPIQVYTATLNPVAASAAYAVTSIGPVAAGNIIRNGSSVDMRNYIPSAVTGYLQTVRIWNGGAAAVVSASLIDETTGVVGTAVVVTGTIPTGGTVRLTQAFLENALGVANFPASVRPRIRFTAPTTKMEVQSFFNNANGAYSNLSGIE